MKKMMFILCAVLALLGTSASSKTLVVYYSYTGNCHEIVTTLTSQIQADVLEIQPADKGLKYEANGYALGTQLLNAIKAAPNNAGSYPAIDPVTTSLDDIRYLEEPYVPHNLSGVMAVNKPVMSEEPVWVAASKNK